MCFTFGLDCRLHFEMKDPDVIKSRHPRVVPTQATTMAALARSCALTDSRRLLLLIPRWQSKQPPSLLGVD
jgi:hypothetical protein